MTVETGLDKLLVQCDVLVACTQRIHGNIRDQNYSVPGQLVRRIAEALREIREGMRKNGPRPKGNVPPSQGGCWFCHRVDNVSDFCFDREFDTYYHEQCLQQALDSVPPEAIDQEAEIINKARSVPLKPNRKNV